MIIQSINPFSQQVIGEHEVLTNLQLQNKLKIAENAFKFWRKSVFQERADKMRNLALVLRKNKEDLALLITNEMGKIISESISEVEKSADNCDFYANHAEQMLKDEYYDTPFKSMSVYDPLGAVFAIMPWNYPFWQVLRYAAPTVMAGNVTILKHASNVTGCAKAIENAFLEAGFAEGIFQQITIDKSQIENVIDSTIVQGITLTGSEAAGSSVASIAGRHIKKTVMELGGSDAFIVLDDANLEKAASVAAHSRMLNAGQACICAKRFIVTEKVADEFVSLFAKNIKMLRQGDPLQKDVHIGPLARLDLAETLAKQLAKTVKQGGKLLLGGEYENCNFQPTLIDFVGVTSVAFQEETFGPLATVTRAKNEEEAIVIANNHRYGLAAAIWTEDRDRAYNLSRKIEAGNVFVNSLVRSDSRIPFGGIKKSGYGRELGEKGIKEFMNMKSIIIE
ncbi:succinate-semialdehyde dehydrogenase / glutarate-semialdehyde dehydrogenase [Flavobacterium segetis]|uniref:Succinate-semialdehyde dehydrogenase / glutarate-semialdehyde dehydrogenase n=1 Tax=Flavobacterium segetis TaxID=271157 RepID=A0A1M5E855_9FLAO|nr:NAD-dependent succinate-semialdehyde dehydrogenase [Flavobacterium segetis]SHF75241.1 succinate-semialdehyde dehydrogenase / glutarate-semialdehyde dehydrogenase [Flavobacterium segetis]